MKLQKLLYFVASEYAKETSRELFSEPFLTWDYGPVLYSVFDEFRAFSRRPILRYAVDATGVAWTIQEGQDPALHQVLNRVWLATRELTASTLSRVTHSKDSAWDQAYQKGEKTLDPQQIRDDGTYRAPLGIPA